MQTSCKNAVRNKKFFIISSNDEVMLTLTDLDLNENIAKKKSQFHNKTPMPSEQRRPTFSDFGCFYIFVVGTITLLLL